MSRVIVLQNIQTAKQSRIRPTYQLNYHVLAANLRVARDNYFYDGCIKIFFTI